MTDLKFIWMLDGEGIRLCHCCYSAVPTRSAEELGQGSVICELCDTSNVRGVVSEPYCYHTGESRAQARLTAQAANYTVLKLGGFKGVKSDCPDCGGKGLAYQRLVGREVELLKIAGPGEATVVDDPGSWNLQTCPTCKGVNL